MLRTVEVDHHWDHRSTGPRVLLVDDADDVRRAVGDHLVQRGMVVHGLADGHRFEGAVSGFRPDVVVLDLNLPGVDGLDLLRGLRRWSDVPVIIVTGRSHEVDRITGLELGADDYLVKPFSAAELAARIRAVLRRGRDLGREQVLRSGDLTIDFATREVAVAGRAVHLTNLEFGLLAFLLSGRPRQVYTREQILEEVWGSSPEWQDTATVTEHVRRVRAKLEEAGQEGGGIETVRGVGYRSRP